MNTRVATRGLRIAARHPRGTVRLGLLAGKNLSTTLFIVGLGRRASKAARPVARAARDPQARSEATRAVREAATAVRHAQAAGAANALTDKRVARSLSRARDHASRAADVAMQRPSRRRRKTTRLLLGAGLIGGMGYAGWRAYSRAGQPDE